MVVNPPGDEVEVPIAEWRRGLRSRIRANRGTRSVPVKTLALNCPWILPKLPWLGGMDWTGGEGWFKCEGAHIDDELRILQNHEPFWTEDLFNEAFREYAQLGCNV